MIKDSEILSVLNFIKSVLLELNADQQTDFQEMLMFSNSFIRFMSIEEE